MRVGDLRRHAGGKLHRSVRLQPQSAPCAPSNRWRDGAGVDRPAPPIEDVIGGDDALPHHAPTESRDLLLNEVLGPRQFVHSRNPSDMRRPYAEICTDIQSLLCARGQALASPSSWS
jgi:hypothetical protein